MINSTGKASIKKTRGKNVKTGKQAVSEDVKGMTVLDHNTFEEEIGFGNPISFISNPLEEVDHDNIPTKLKKAIVETYGEEYFTSKVWTRSQLARLNQAISRPRENLTGAIAKICDPTCHMKDICPYDIAGNPPIGDRCPIELQYAKESHKEYTLAVSERLGITVEDILSDIVLHNFVNGLVEADMVEARLNHDIAHNGYVTAQPSVINQLTGDVHTKEEESVAIRIKDRVAKRRDQIYRQLLATPEMAEKYKRGKEEDTISRQNKVLSKLEEMVKKAEEKDRPKIKTVENINA
jgi:hypothetical protein